MCKKTFSWILNSQSWYHFDKQTCILLYIRTFILVFFIHTTALKKMPISLRLLRSFFSVALFTKSYNSQSIWNKLPKCIMTICFTMQFYSRHVSCWMFLVSFCTFSKETNLSIFDALKRQCGADFLSCKNSISKFHITFYVFKN